MIIVISPAKTLDMSEQSFLDQDTQPDLLEDTQELVSFMSKFSSKDLAELMSVSDKIAELNFDRYQNFAKIETKQAILAFKGDVYKPLEVESYTKEDFSFAQKHLRILSGLYGTLRPLDLIHPYRLEMGTRFNNYGIKNLYSFWGNKITKLINIAAQNSNSRFLLNLASNEYFKSINRDILEIPIINVNFKEKRDEKFKTIALLAKRARGMMTNYIIKNKITSLDKVKKFSENQYRFDEGLSDNSQITFTR